MEKKIDKGERGGKLNTMKRIHLRNKDMNRTQGYTNTSQRLRIQDKDTVIKRRYTLITRMKIEKGKYRQEIKMQIRGMMRKGELLMQV